MLNPELNPEHELRRMHLKRALDTSSLKQAEFARKIEVTPQYLSLMLKEGFRFGEKAARKFEEKLKLPKGAMDASLDKHLHTIEVWDRPEDLPEGVFALVPRISVLLSAGGGAHQGEEMELPPLAFREDWLRKKNVTSRSNLRICEVKGDSMEGYLQDGDTVLIDMGQREVIDNQVYALQYGVDLRVKRLARRFDGGLFIRSDNQRYPEEIISSNEVDQIIILGRQIWRGGG
jgi:phage repressor protein C with HTH and peptisase S24 domain